jgi:hypothetical protein
LSVARERCVADIVIGPRHPMVLAEHHFSCVRREEAPTEDAAVLGLQRAGYAG